ncbi:MAG: methylenetetrahydrofolate--tRNA-(uracil(54)-C(5))-methyltransferase (FADH(2)-oxidizing) TrmFO [Deltaproteobacteria bacterium]|nr:methylenetetrahydrofolate--tRNA-(uracil(54)-C(5))-methyltransferase (FADH(2)-oxidizing) TrmFO [Deltaproteobacteria bacterium]
MSAAVTVVGAGLAGSECAWQLAERGIDVRLVEQKPVARTPAQVSDGFAELVCSNSLRGAALTNAVGCLKEEMRRARSLVIRAADATRVPAGGALAVDREAFSSFIESRLRGHRRITIENRVVESIPSGPVVLATGPLTGTALAADLAARVGADQLAYYDAISPIVSADSIRWDEVFRASRWDKGGDDAYVNCPLDADRYRDFVAAVIAAEKAEARPFEELRYFEGCLPIEVMASRGERTLAFGPMKPVGLTDPRTGRWPYAVVQLRQEDEGATAYNLVGFQTRMKQGEQRRVFAMIPGLQEAEYLRFGSVHRNTFVRAPVVLDEMQQLRGSPGVYLAGQITGVEGYVESAAHGLLVGARLAMQLAGLTPATPPATTTLGGLLGHLSRNVPDYQPSNVMWSMVPPFPQGDARCRLKKADRYAAYAERALADVGTWIDAVAIAPLDG